MVRVANPQPVLATTVCANRSDCSPRWHCTCLWAKYSARKANATAEPDERLKPALTECKSHSSQAPCCDDAGQPARCTNLQATGRSIAPSQNSQLQMWAGVGRLTPAALGLAAGTPSPYQQLRHPADYAAEWSECDAAIPTWMLDAPGNLHS